MKQPPLIRIETHWLPRAGHSESEYEDAFGTSDPETFPFRAAVSDGATESAFSGEWARGLVAQYLNHGALVEAAASARTLFVPALDGRWYVEAKAAEGAFAALLGLELVDDEGGETSWRAESVGDCCLFHVRDGAVRRSWPFEDADEFHHRPKLVSSLADDEEIETTRGTWRAGDTFILVTDALAAYVLTDGIGPLLTCTAFERFVAKARRDSSDVSLRNDDTTALIIRL